VGKRGACGYHSTVKIQPTPLAAALKACLNPLRATIPALAALLLLSSSVPAQPRTTPVEAPNLPSLGDTEREDLSPALERKLGEEIMRDIRADHDYLDDAPILEYLGNFGNALVAARPGVRGETSFDFFFFAVRDAHLNAFALPGGFIAVHSGLLLAAQSESELASVLSHEIGHVAQRHIARMLGQQRQDSLIPLAGLVLAALAARSGGDAAIGTFMASEGVALQRQLNFSRNAEREADRIGFQIMGEAGFDTSGMVAFFGRLQTSSRSYSDLTPAYLQSHPLTTERIADIQARVREQPYRQRPDSLDFHLVRARARVLQDESVQGLQETQVYFDSQLQLQSRPQVAAAQYGLALLALKKGELAKAQSWLDAARASADKAPTMSAGSFGMAPPAALPDPIFASLALDIQLAPGQGPQVAKQALKAADAAHQQFPLSRGIARQYAQALAGAGQLEHAASFLRDQVQQYRQEPKLYDLLAKTYAQQGKQALQHIALAESYLQNGGTMAALDQLAIARKASDATFYDQSVIDARERELQARRREELKANRK